MVIIHESSLHCLEPYLPQYDFQAKSRLPRRLKRGTLSYRLELLNAIRRLCKFPLSEPYLALVILMA